MKLLQINSVANIGSTGQIAEGIGQLVLSNGGESYIAYGRNYKNSKNQLFKIGNDFNVKVHGLLTRIFDNHSLGFSSKKATKKLIIEIDSIKPDIIHLHNIHGYYINSEILFEYLSKLNVPVLWTLHDCWSFTGHCAHFDDIGCEKWKTQCYSCPLKKNYPASYFFDRSKKNYIEKNKLFNSIKNLTIVPVSNWLENMVKDSFLSKIQINVIHNGIDINIFKPRIDNTVLQVKYGLKNKFILLGVASPWSERKGLNDFIKLSPLIAPNMIIILVGLNEKQIKSLPQNIIGLRKTEDINQLADLYSMSNLFINFSSEETFGLTTVEAFSSGTPVIVYNSTASPEIVSEETGFVVEKGDLHGVLRAIEIVKNNGKQYYSQKCRERAETHFNKDIQFQKYIDLYNQLLKK